MNSGLKLDFVVIGVQKSATTWIYDCLKDHPYINLRNSKDEAAYFGGALYKENGEAWYFSQFNKKKSGQIRGCISVEYIEDPNSPRNLYHLNPDIKIIASLRHPTDRAVSAYQWYVRKTLIPDLPIEEGIREAIKHYYHKVKNEFSPAYINIIERGLYAKKLQSFYKLFPQSQVKINFFDEVKQNPLNAIQDIMAFLKIERGFIPPNVNTIPKKNTGFQPLIKIQRRFPNSKAIGKLVDVSNQLLYKKTKIISVNGQITPETREQIDNICEASLQELSMLFDMYQPKLKTIMNEFWR